ncbi:hypothetical protein AYI70_g1175 [Smittium culicis]|uniref:Uncharacterized protein n=1 Tax=Smittium culicis TaxID=133412 RepID=A0A1R1YDP7_9FUNG|nr:hypothetical protein AYI70_g1175 [Smittium culicis]
MNALLSTTDISTFRFALATSISLIKLLLYVFIGAQTQSLVEVIGGLGSISNNGHLATQAPNEGKMKASVLRTVTTVLSIILIVGVSLYTYYLVNREIEREKKTETEAETENQTVEEP